MRLVRELTILFFTMAFFLLGAPGSWAEDPPSDRAALVDGVPISRAAFLTEVKRLQRKSGQVSQAPSPSLRRQALENLITRLLICQEAARRGIRVTREEVTAEIDLIKKGVKEGALKGTLERMGIEPEELSDQVEKGMTVQRFIDREFGGKSPVTKQEIADYYRDHAAEFKKPLGFRLSHILARFQPGDESLRQKAWERIEYIRRRIAAGEDFIALAREESDAFNAKSGADLGYFHPGELSPKMEHAARALKLNEVSAAIEDRFGFHLLRVTELTPETVSPLEKVQEKIRQELAREKGIEALAPFVKKLRAGAKIEILLDEDPS